MPLVQVGEDTIQFPDSMSEEEITAVILEQYKPKTKEKGRNQGRNVQSQFENNTGLYNANDEINALEAAAIGFGGGISRFGSGLAALTGLKSGDEVREEEFQRQDALRKLREDFPVAGFTGEVAGEIAPAIAPGLGLGGLATSTLGRYGVSAALSGADLGILAAGRDPTPSNVALNATLGAGLGAAGEFAAPFISKGAQSIGERTGLIKPPTITPEMTQEAIQEAAAKLRQAGRSDQEIAMFLEDVQSLPTLPRSGDNPFQLERAATLEAQGISPSGRSRITGAPEDFALEKRLAGSPGGAANIFRERLFEENKTITDRIDAVANQHGKALDANQSLQDVFFKLESRINAEKSQAYRDLADAIDLNPEVARKTPLPTTNLVDSIEENLSRLNAHPEAQGALDKLLFKYKLLDEGDGWLNVSRQGARNTTLFNIESGETVKFKGAQKTLDLRNYESFRKELNHIFDPKVPAQAAARRDVIDQLDNSFNSLVDNLTAQGGDGQILEKAKRARALAHEEFKVFAPERLAGKITRIGSDGNPLLDASKLYGEIEKATPEEFTRVMQHLTKMSRQGSRKAAVGGLKETREALGNVKAAVVTNLLEQATKDKSKLLASSTGDEAVQINAKALTKGMDKFGRDKLKKLFGENYKDLLRLERAANTLNPRVPIIGDGGNPLTRAARTLWVLSGNVVKRTAGEIAEVAATGHVQSKRLGRATDFSIDNETANAIRASAPRTAVILGIGSAAEAELHRQD